MTAKKHICKVAILLLLSVSAACAQDDFPVPTFMVESPAIWLEPYKEGFAALLENGEVSYWDGDVVSPFEDSVVGDSIISCGGAIYGVGEADVLVKLESNLEASLDLKVRRYARPTCLDDDLIILGANDELLRLDSDLEVVARASLNTLPDAEIVQADLTGDGASELIILSDPTERYAHAVLGDALEASTVSVFSKGLEPLASYTLEAPFVFEQRRVLPFEFRQAGENRQGLLATRSSNATGAGVVLLAMDDGKLEILAEAQPIGTGFRWLNAFAAADGSAYAVRTPHIGGPLQRYRFNGETLEIESFDLGVTNHIYGQRNLDLGVLLSAEDEAHTLAAALNTRDGVRLITCSQSCEATQTLLMRGKLSSNVAPILTANQIQIAFADTSGGVYIQEVD